MRYLILLILISFLLVSCSKSALNDDGMDVAGIERMQKKIDSNIVPIELRSDSASAF